MENLTRKQREIQEREALILEVARKMLIERGYLGVTMDRIAQAIEYSKGTVYQHFSSKEDVLVALAGETTRTRADLFRRAAAFNGTSRERMTGIGVADELFVRLFPQHWHAEQIIRAASIQSKATRDHLKTLESTEAECFDAVSVIIMDAIGDGDLIPEGHEIPQTIAYGLWSLSFGSHFIAASNPNLGSLAMEDESAMLNRNYHALLDGYGWQPLSSAHDYIAVQDRIRREVFPEESRRVGLIEN